MAEEMAAFYRPYVERCPGEDLFAALRSSSDENRALFERITPELADLRYAPGKWTIKEVIQHWIDTERIFAYRALRFARNDRTSLPGFDENAYVEQASTATRRSEDLFKEATVVREATIQLYQSFDETMLMRVGTANDNPFSVRALGWIIAGHNLHHARIINERYLDHALA